MFNLALLPERGQTIRALAAFSSQRPAPDTAEILVLPLYRMVIQRLKRQVLTQVTSDRRRAAFSIRAEATAGLSSKGSRCEVVTSV